MAGRRRPRFRYVVVRVDSEASISEADFAEMLSRLPLGRSLKLICFDGASGIVRCTNIDKDMAVAALNSVYEIRRMTVKVVTLGTSGTIRKARKKFLR